MRLLNFEILRNDPTNVTVSRVSTMRTGPKAGQQTLTDTRYTRSLEDAVKIVLRVASTDEIQKDPTPNQLLEALANMEQRALEDLRKWKDLAQKEWVV